MFDSMRKVSELSLKPEDEADLSLMMYLKKWDVQEYNFSSQTIRTGVRVKEETSGSEYLNMNKDSQILNELTGVC